MLNIVIPLVYSNICSNFATEISNSADNNSKTIQLWRILNHLVN
jgi:hypothetical protein